LDRTECHYFINAGFFPFDGYLLSEPQISKIRHIPTSIVQGRFDSVCPARSAYDLHKAFPEAKFEIVTAGHSSAEKEIEDRLLKATEEMKKLD
jgi:proline iminopeptidase